jgi:hypothetical protein
MTKTVRRQLVRVDNEGVIEAPSDASWGRTDICGVSKWY